MNIYTKDVAPLGFKGTGLFDDSKWHHMYFLELPKRRRFYIIDNLAHTVSHFSLSVREYKLFKQDRLSLVPHGCCDAGNADREIKEHPHIDLKKFDEKFDSKQEFLDYVKELITK